MILCVRVRVLVFSLLLEFVLFTCPCTCNLHVRVLVNFVRFYLLGFLHILMRLLVLVSLYVYVDTSLSAIKYAYKFLYVYLH